MTSIQSVYLCRPQLYPANSTNSIAILQKIGCFRICFITKICSKRHFTQLCKWTLFFVNISMFFTLDGENVKRFETSILSTTLNCILLTVLITSKYCWNQYLLRIKEQNMPIKRTLYIMYVPNAKVHGSSCFMLRSVLAIFSLVK